MGVGQSMQQVIRNKLPKCLLDQSTTTTILLISDALVGINIQQYRYTNERSSPCGLRSKRRVGPFRSLFLIIYCSLGKYLNCLLQQRIYLDFGIFMIFGLGNPQHPADKYRIPKIPDIPGHHILMVFFLVLVARTD